MELILMLGERKEQFYQVIIILILINIISCIVLSRKENKLQPVVEVKSFELLNKM